MTQYTYQCPKCSIQETLNLRFAQNNEQFCIKCHIEMSHIIESSTFTFNPVNAKGQYVGNPTQEIRKFDKKYNK